MWSPWGPYMVKPCDIDTEEDHVDTSVAQPTQPTQNVVKRKPAKNPMQKLKTWGGYATYATLVAGVQMGESDSDPMPRASDDSKDTDSQCDKAPSSTGCDTQETRRDSIESESFPFDPFGMMSESPFPESLLQQPPAQVTGKKRRPARKKKASTQKCSVPANAGTNCDTPQAQNMDAGVADAAVDMDTVTTLVVRNLPRSLTQQELVQAMEESGYGGTWDFCYLPYKFQARSNFGFAFVNFTSPEMAQKFMQGWHQTRPFSFGRVRKPVNVAAAAVQGRQANEQKAQWLMGQVKNPAYQPVLLDNHCEGLVD